MASRTSEEAQTKVCWLALESGEAFLCYGEDCFAWEREPELHRSKHEGDITPRGYCLLLEARLRGE